MSSTAEMPRPAVGWPRQRRDGLLPALSARPVYGVIAAASVLLAALSLLYPSTPTYDPWSWLVWGREILHLSLSTTGGPSWKPLPVLFTTLFAPFGSAAPDLWLIVARAGGLATLALAGLLGVRLMRAVRAGPVAAVAAGIAVSCALALMPSYIDYVALGESEGLLAAATLMVALRHLDGAPRGALFWGFVVALDRPEAWPLFALYAIYVWRSDPGARRLVALLSALILPLWFVPEALGSGSLMRGVQTAQHPRPEAATFARCPFCTEITDHALRLVAPPLWAGTIALLVLLLLRARRRHAPSRGELVMIAAAAVGLVWFLEEAMLTETGFSGNNRYLVGAAALVTVTGVVGWYAAARAVVMRVRARVGTPALVLSAAGAAVATSTLLVSHHAIHVSTSPTETSLRYQAGLRRDLRVAIDQAGGAGSLLACGAIGTNPSEVPLAAWTAELPLASVGQAAAPVIIRTRNAPQAVLLPRVPAHAGYREVARQGDVSIYTSCPAS